MALRILYTNYARKHPNHPLTTACNAADTGLVKSETFIDDKGEKDGPVVSTNAIEHPSQHTILPQYTASATTALGIRETSLPSLSGSFSISAGSQELFTVSRERLSYSERRVLFDAQTGATLLTLRRNVGHVPISYRVEDPTGATVLDLQGGFFVPFTGAKSAAYLIDPATGRKVHLAIKGSYRNRKGAVVNAETGEELVKMESALFEARNFLTGRRTYRLEVSEGMDMALAVMIIVAMDARSA